METPLHYHHPSTPLRSCPACLQPAPELRPTLSLCWNCPLLLNVLRTLLINRNSQLLTPGPPTSTPNCPTVLLAHIPACHSGATAVPMLIKQGTQSPPILCPWPTGEYTALAPQRGRAGSQGPHSSAALWDKMQAARAIHRAHTLPKPSERNKTRFSAHRNLS